MITRPRHITAVARIPHWPVFGVPLPLFARKVIAVLHLLTSGFDPDVWSGREVQEDSSILAMRSCINVSGF